MTKQEQKWLETNNQMCALLRQVHDALALSSLPPRREWVGLTDEDFNSDMFSITSLGVCDIAAIKSIAKDVEAKLKEKNNG